jgi:hypothetical protein
MTGSAKEGVLYMSANEKQVGGKHYKSGYEHWDLAVAIPLGYLEGTTTKYISRWRKKGGMQDLEKALHYLDKLIEVTFYNVNRVLGRLEIKVEVNRFAHINNLSILEEEYIFMLCTYETRIDLETARLTLLDMIEGEELRRNSLIRPEPNYPGTPEDGGHHAQE